MLHSFFILLILFFSFLSVGGCAASKPKTIYQIKLKPIYNPGGTAFNSNKQFAKSYNKYAQKRIEQNQLGRDLVLDKSLKINLSAQSKKKYPQGIFKSKDKSSKNDSTITAGGLDIAKLPGAYYVQNKSSGFFKKNKKIQPVNDSDVVCESPMTEKNLQKKIGEPKDKDCDVSDDLYLEDDYSSKKDKIKPIQSISTIKTEQLPANKMLKNDLNVNNKIKKSSTSKSGNKKNNASNFKSEHLSNDVYSDIEDESSDIDSDMSNLNQTPNIEICSEEEKHLDSAKKIETSVFVGDIDDLQNEKIDRFFYKPSPSQSKWSASLVGEFSSFKFDSKKRYRWIRYLNNNVNMNKIKYKIS